MEHFLEFRGEEIFSRKIIKGNKQSYDMELKKLKKMVKLKNVKGRYKLHMCTHSEEHNSPCILKELGD